LCVLMLLVAVVPVVVVCYCRCCCSWGSNAAASILPEWCPPSPAPPALPLPLLPPHPLIPITLPIVFSPLLHPPHRLLAPAAPSPSSSRHRLLPSSPTLLHPLLFCCPTAAKFKIKPP
jgi:hypothetical protein